MSKVSINDDGKMKKQSWSIASMMLKAKKISICFLSDIRKGSSFSLLGVKVLFVLFLRLGLECYVYPVKCL